METKDPRPMFFRAVDQAVRLIAQVTPEQHALPTPCTEYDVQTLLGHLITVLRRIAVVGSGGNALEVPAVSHDVGPAGWADAAADLRAKLDAVWADDALLDRPFTLPFATLPGRAALLAYTQELTQHAWDLATATGRAAELDPALAEAVLDLARRFVPAESRGGRVPFGPVVDVPEDADPYARLAGWLGRTPV